MARPVLRPFQWKSSFGTAAAVADRATRKRAMAVLDGRRVVLDTETTSVARDRALRLVQFGWAKRVWLVDPQSKHGKIVFEHLISRLEEGGLCVIGHNVVFDLLTIFAHAYSGKHGDPWYYNTIERMGRQDRILDTMVATQVANCERHYRRLSELAGGVGVHNNHEARFNDLADSRGWTTDEKFALVPINNKRYLKYAAHDIHQTREVYRDLNVKGVWKHPLVLSETRCELLYATMTHRGMGVDIARAEALYQEQADRLAGLRRKLAKRGVGGENKRAETAGALLGLGAVLTERTATGEWRTDKGTLANVAEPPKARKLAQNVLAARSVKRDQGMVLNIAQKATDGRVHPKLWRIGAITGRSSCAEPPLQQLNKNTGDKRVRGILTADEGHRLATVDYNSMEVRVLADLTNDRVLIDHLNDGADVHGEVARRVYGAQYTQAQRNRAKAGVFAMLYGAGDSGVAHASGATVEEAIAIQHSWWATYKTAHRVAQDWGLDARQMRVAVLPNGWKVPIYQSDKGSKDFSYRAVNYKCQGMAAFIFRAAAEKLAKLGHWSAVRMVVHDEFACSFPEEWAERMAREFAEAAEVDGENIRYTTSWEVCDGRWWE